MKWRKTYLQQEGKTGTGLGIRLGKLGIKENAGSTANAQGYGETSARKINVHPAGKKYTVLLARLSRETI